MGERLHGVTKASQTVCAHAHTDLNIRCMHMPTCIGYRLLYNYRKPMHKFATCGVCVWGGGG